MNDRQLYTIEGENLSGIPWDIYPRPQMRRTEWQCLNGMWKLQTGSVTDGSCETDIRVPFCPESLLSGFNGHVEYGKVLRYSRHFSIPGEWRSKRIILHFGAVNNRCKIFVNKKKVCEHENGYLAFEVDITDMLNQNASDNLLEVTVINDLSGRLPTGKQKVKRGGMWYTPVSGIWQSVWLEPVPDKYIGKLKISADLTGADISVQGEGVREGTIICEGREYAFTDGKVRIEPENKRLWSPEEPYLYSFTVNCGTDCVESYFALRTVSVGNFRGIPRLCLNGKPYFFNGLLDQGYFSDGLYTPAVPGLYEKDILAVKALGFNTLRKHIKIEPEQFYYDCDRLGMIVFQDMVNNGGYSFFTDTLLPTIGLKRRNDRKMHRNPKFRPEFLRAMELTAEQLYDHPCICYWTIFNEGWGQFEADRAYDRLKAIDESRIIDSTSGWFHQKKSDVDSLHVYFKKLKTGKKIDMPQVMSEFGGYVYKIPEHSYNLEKTYGYKILPDRVEFVNALRKLYIEEVLPLVKMGLSAAIYTQVSDVEDETNGLLTYDRRICKLEPEEFLDAAKMLADAGSDGSAPDTK